MRVLTCVARSTKIYSLGEIADYAGASRPGVRLAAERLAEQGLLDEISIGRTRGYSLNREHVLTEPLLAAANGRATAISRIRERIEGWTLPAQHAVLFGSAARREGDASSDVDLLIVPQAEGAHQDDLWSTQILELVTAVRRWTGNSCDVVTLSPKEWSDLSDSDEPFAVEIRREGMDLLEQSRAFLASSSQ
ncbi:putative nucleotidyltransferase [Kineosphaera limosa]|nr:nucleotidyltransferase domain-containing protein [Kineosphaera limosa]NYE02107.1 putative nucleotidyltransferase [Kineosphaera limosa]